MVITVHQIWLWPTIGKFLFVFGHIVTEMWLQMTLEGFIKHIFCDILANILWRCITYNKAEYFSTALHVNSKNIAFACLPEKFFWEFSSYDVSFAQNFHVFLLASKDDPIFAKKQTQSLDNLLQWDAAIIKVKLYLSERRYSARIEANKQFHCNRWCKTGKLRQRKSSTDWKEIEEALRKRNCEDLMHVRWHQRHLQTQRALWYRLSYVEDCVTQSGQTGFI